MFFRQSKNEDCMNRPKTTIYFNVEASVISVSKFTESARSIHGAKEKFSFEAVFSCSFTSRGELIFLVT